MANCLELLLPKNAGDYEFGEGNSNFSLLSVFNIFYYDDKPIDDFKCIQ